MEVKIEKNIDREVPNIIKLYFQELKNRHVKEYWWTTTQDWMDNTEKKEIKSGEIYTERIPIVGLSKNPDDFGKYLKEENRVKTVKYIEDHRRVNPYIQVGNHKGRYTYFQAKYFAKGLNIILEGWSFGTYVVDMFCEQDTPFMFKFETTDLVPDDKKEKGIVLIGPIDFEGGQDES